MLQVPSSPMVGLRSVLVSDISFCPPHKIYLGLIWRNFEISATSVLIGGQEIHQCLQKVLLRYLRPIGGASFNQIGGHDFHWGSFQIRTRYSGPLGGAGFNWIGGHDFQWGCSQILTVGILNL